ncbi:hypothetical protein NUM3379_07050 [Kineococcus sp. NUM-3379]
MSRVRRTAAAAVLTLAAAVLPAVGAAAAPPTGAQAFPETVPLPAGSQPEGIADGPGTTFFAGSRADGSIYRGDLATGRGEVLVRGVPGRVAVGMVYDERTDRLWVAGGATGAVTAYDGGTGQELGRWVVPGSGFLNDLDVTNQGVYVTDSQKARLVVIPLRGNRLPGPGAARAVTLTGDLRYGPGFNLNGIRDLPGQALVAVQSNTGKLFRIDPRTGVTTELRLRGRALRSGDGLVLFGRTLYVVYGFGTDEVAVVLLDADRRGGRVVGGLTDPDLDRPTTAIFTGGSMWLVNGRFATPPTPSTPYDVVRLDAQPR